MKAVLTCRLSSGKVLEITPQMFSVVKFEGSEVLSGDKYYVAKAVELGAKKPKSTTKAKKKVE